MTKETFLACLESPSMSVNLDMKLLSQLSDVHSYSSTVQMVYAKILRSTNSIYFEDQLKKTALVASDRRKLYQLIVSEPSQKIDFQNKNAKANNADVINSENETKNIISESNDSLDDTIVASAVNASIQKELLEMEEKSLIDLAEEISHKKLAEQNESEVQKEASLPKELPSKLSFNNWLHAGSSQVHNKNDEIRQLVDQYVPAKSEQKQFYSASKMAAKSLIDQEEIVTETLAKIYADQGNTAKAIAAYKRLSLKFPEKSVLFAGRIKDLEKLKPK